MTERIAQGSCSRYEFDHIDGRSVHDFAHRKMRSLRYLQDPACLPRHRADVDRSTAQNVDAPDESAAAPVRVRGVYAHACSGSMSAGTILKRAQTCCRNEARAVVKEGTETLW